MIPEHAHFAQIAVLTHARSSFQTSSFSGPPGVANLSGGRHPRATGGQLRASLNVPAVPWCQAALWEVVGGPQSAVTGVWRGGRGGGGSLGAWRCGGELSTPHHARPLEKVRPKLTDRGGRGAPAVVQPIDSVVNSWAVAHVARPRRCTESPPSTSTPTLRLIDSTHP